MAVKRILVVDDDREWNFLLKMRLEIAGYKGEQAFNGKEALEKIGANRPDLVLLDITMPVMDGWEVCRALREQPATKDLSVIIQSSFTRPEDVEKGKLYQVKRYLIKPCLPDVILQNIRDVFAQPG